AARGSRVLESAAGAPPRSVSGGPRAGRGTPPLFLLRAVEVAADGGAVLREDACGVRRPAARGRAAQRAGLRRTTLRVLLRGRRTDARRLALFQRREVGRRQRLLAELRPLLARPLAELDRRGAGPLVHPAAARAVAHRLAQPTLAVLLEELREALSVALPALARLELVRVDQPPVGELAGGLLGGPLPRLGRRRELGELLRRQLPALDRLAEFVAQFPPLGRRLLRHRRQFRHQARHRLLVERRGGLLQRLGAGLDLP